MLKLKFSSLALLTFSTLIASHDMACAMLAQDERIAPFPGRSGASRTSFQPTLGMPGARVVAKTSFQPMDTIKEVSEDAPVKKTLPTERKKKPSSGKTRKTKVQKNETDPK